MEGLKLRVKEGFKEDFGKGIARIDPEIFSEVKINTGDIVYITNINTKKSTGTYIFSSDLRDKGSRIIRIGVNLRRNLQVAINDIITIKKTKLGEAQQVSFAGFQKGIILKNPKIIVKKLNNKLVSKGDIFTFRSGNKKVDLIVVNHTPDTKVVKINENTTIYCQETSYIEGI